MSHGPSDGANHISPIGRRIGAHTASLAVNNDTPTLGRDIDFLAVTVFQSHGIAMDPLTISTGILACISISLKVLVGLKQLKANVGGGSIGNASIDALADDISGLRRVLQSMEDAFQDIDDDQVLRETGHAGTHWRNLRRCLNDEHGVLSDFDEMLFDLIKKVKVLAPSRMKSRLQSAATRFLLVGQQVQTYKDAFEVSLDVLILSKSVSLSKSASGIDPTVTKRDIPGSMAKVEARIKALEDAVAESAETKTIDAVAKLKQCAASATSLFSSAPTPTPAEAQLKPAESLPPSSRDGVMEWISSVDGARLQTPPSEDSGFESASPQTTATQPQTTRKPVRPGTSPTAPPTPAASSPSPAASPANISDAPPSHGHSAVQHHPPHRLSPQQQSVPGPVIMYMSPVPWNGQNQNHSNSPMSPMFPVQVIYGPPPSSNHQRASFQQPVMPLRSQPQPPTGTHATQHVHRATDSAPSLPSPPLQPTPNARLQPTPQQPQKQPELQPPPKAQPKLQLRTQQLPLPRSQVQSLPTSLPRPQPSYGNSDEGSEPRPGVRPKLTKLQKQPKGASKTAQADSWDSQPETVSRDNKSRFSLGQPIPTKRKSQNPFTGLRRLMPGSGEHLTRRQKLCFVGDSRCGKTCLLTTTTKGSFPEAYEPTTFENYVSDVDVSNIGRMELEIWDTAGQEIYDNLRALSYPDSQALVLCFSIGDPLSYHNLLEKWLPEATRFCPETPIFVIGCKQDLRFDPKTIGELQRCGQLPLTTAEGLAAAGRIGARYYMETSAKSGYGVDNLLVIIAEEIQRTRQLEPITNLARRFHEDARVINEERRNFRATGEILTPREKDYASRYVRIMDEPSSTVWKLQEEQVVDKAVNASRTSFFRKSS